MLSILLQLAVGVSEDEIIAEYSRSYELLQGSKALEQLYVDVKKVNIPAQLWAETPPYVCENTLQHIHKLGGIEKYLDSVGFDRSWRDRLKRAVLVEP